MNPCHNCQHYHGRTYSGEQGSNHFVCGMHPYGTDGEECADWEEKSRSSLVEEISESVRAAARMAAVEIAEIVSIDSETTIDEESGVLHVSASIQLPPVLPEEITINIDAEGSPTFNAQPTESEIELEWADYENPERPRSGSVVITSNQEGQTLYVDGLRMEGPYRDLRPSLECSWHFFSPSLLPLPISAYSSNHEAFQELLDEMGVSHDPPISGHPSSFLEFSHMADWISDVTSTSIEVPEPPELRMRDELGPKYKVRPGPMRPFTPRWYQAFNDIERPELPHA